MAASNRGNKLEHELPCRNHEKAQPSRIAHVNHTRRKISSDHTARSDDRFSAHIHSGHGGHPTSDSGTVVDRDSDIPLMDVRPPVVQDQVRKGCKKGSDKD